jgi:hypothetical protein
MPNLPVGIFEGADELTMRDLYLTRVAGGEDPSRVFESIVTQYYVSVATGAAVNLAVVVLAATQLTHCDLSAKWQRAALEILDQTPPDEIYLYWADQTHELRAARRRMLRALRLALATYNSDFPPPFDSTRLPDFLRVDYGRKRRLGAQWGITHPPRSEMSDG